MPTPTYRPLATVTLGTAVSSVSFSSIPSSYRDLILVYNATGNSSQVCTLQINGSAANGSTVSMVGASGFVVSNTSTTLIGGLIDTTRGVNILQFMDYSATDKHKTYLIRADRAAANTVAYAARWAQTSAINSIAVFTGSGNFDVGSVFSIYGVIA